MPTNTLVLAGIPSSQTVQITNNNNNAAVHGVRNGETAAAIAEPLTERKQPKDIICRYASATSCAEFSNSTNTKASFLRMRVRELT
jgi:hypothetical protein